MRGEDDRYVSRKAWALLPAIFLACLLPACHSGDSASAPADTNATGQPSHQVAGGNANRGKAAIQTLGCAACHTIPGIRATRGMVGPPLADFAGRVFIAGEVPNTTASLIQWIRNPQSIEPKTAMPNLGVTEEQAHNIAAYLYTLR